VTGITFGPDGSIAPANQAAARLVATPAWTGGAAAGNISINFGQYTQYSAPSSMIFKTKNGSTVGEVQDYEIDKSGRIMASLTNGSIAQVGTIQLATFVNVDGLQRIGNGSYIAGTDAGAVSIGAPGTKGKGVTRGSSLERSTTDMSGEFVNLVVYQRGYQANSQILNAANEILQQTIGLIR
jgi:flagellar hook protein FlgE